VRPSVGFLRRLFGELAKVAGVEARAPGKVPCPECGGAQWSWRLIVETGKCGLEHPVELPSIVIKGGKAA
jgi:hypothetical protein